LIDLTTVGVIVVPDVPVVAAEDAGLVEEPVVVVGEETVLGEEAEGLFAGEDVLLAEGAVVAARGTVVAAEGTVVAAGGALVAAEGAVFAAAGAVGLADVAPLTVVTLLDVGVEALEPLVVAAATDDCDPSLPEQALSDRMDMANATPDTTCFPIKLVSHIVTIKKSASDRRMLFKPFYVKWTHVAFHRRAAGLSVTCFTVEGAPWYERANFS
jgi:hypothetical protein